MQILSYASFLLIPAVAAIVFLFLQVKKLRKEKDSVTQERDQLKTDQGSIQTENASLKQRLEGIVDLDAEKAKLQADNARLKEGIKEWIQKFNAQKERMQKEFQDERLKEQNERNAKKQEAEQRFDALKQQQEKEIKQLQVDAALLRGEFQGLEEQAEMQSFGFYKPRYDFANSQAYQSELERIRAEQKQMIKDKTAAVCNIEWTVNGSKTEGRKQTNQSLKLMLRAFNGESDAAIAKVRYNNIQVMENRISAAWKAINSMNEVQQCTISEAYWGLKLRELYLAHEYQEKVQAEKEEQRRIREEMREEEIARRELEKAQQDAEREERRYEDALAKARLEAQQAVGAKQEILQARVEELQRRLDEAHSNKERAIARAQMTKSGHVYVISNIGSFGEHVYKIGMTRRLDPLDRVRELGDASVPFLFDVHAIIYSDDAPALEAALHRKFNHCRINRVNERKEFFRATIEEISEVVRAHHGEIEFVKDAEAVEYRKTVAMSQEMQTVNGTLSNPVILVAQ